MNNTWAIPIAIVVGMISGSVITMCILTPSFTTPSITIPNIVPSFIQVQFIQDKEEYCGHYAQYQMWARAPMSREDTVDPVIAEQLCNCWWEEWPDNSMYGGITRCEAK